jgi:hypothetical protein
VDVGVAADGQQDTTHANETDGDFPTKPWNPVKGPGWSSLSEAFGYDGRTECNTMTLVLKLAAPDERAEVNLKDNPVSKEAEDLIHRALNMMPSRHIIDFLVQDFVTEVNWIDQVLYPPWFLGQYQRWWALNRVSTVAEIEFAILILRICCYASQFLPSPNYTLDSIKGVTLAEIRKSCEDVIYILGPICTRMNPRGSLIRVQHIGYGGLAAGSACRMNIFWESVSCASRVAQQLGLHLDDAISASNASEMEKEMRRRTYCNLYIWDRYGPMSAFISY